MAHWRMQGLLSCQGEKQLNTVTHLLNSQRRGVKTGTSKVILEVKGISNGKVTS